MKIDEMRSYAESNGFDSVEFEFTNLRNEKVRCVWLDAYMGLFRIGGQPGFITVDDWKKMTKDTFELNLINNEHE